MSVGVVCQYNALRSAVVPCHSALPTPTLAALYNAGLHGEHYRVGQFLYIGGATLAGSLYTGGQSLYIGGAETGRQHLYIGGAG